MGCHFRLRRLKGVVSLISGLAPTVSAEVAVSPTIAAPEQSFTQALAEASGTSDSQVSAASGNSVQFFGGWTATASTEHAPKPNPFDPQPATAAAAAPAATTTPTPCGGNGSVRAAI